MSESRDIEIFNAIRDLRDYIEECTSGRKVRLESDELETLINAIETSIPEDIRAASSIIDAGDQHIERAKNQADSIIANAKIRESGIIDSAEASAASIIKRAEEEKARLVSQDEVTQTAIRQKNDMIAKTEEICRVVYNRTQNEAQEILYEAEETVAHCSTLIESARAAMFAEIDSVRERMTEQFAALDDMMKTCYSRIDYEKERISGREEDSRHVIEDEDEVPASSGKYYEAESDNDYEPETKSRDSKNSDTADTFGSKKTKTDKNSNNDDGSDDASFTGKVKSFFSSLFTDEIDEDSEFSDDDTDSGFDD